MWICFFILKGIPRVLGRVLVVLIWFAIEGILTYYLLYLIRKFKIVLMETRNVTLKRILCNIKKCEKNCDVEGNVLYQMEIYEYQIEQKKSLINEIFVDESLIEKISHIKNMFENLIDDNDLVYVKNKKGEKKRINSLNELMNRYLELLCQRKIAKYSFLITDQHNEVKIQVSFNRNSVIKLIYNENNKKNIESKMKRQYCQ